MDYREERGRPRVLRLGLRVNDAAVAVALWFLAAIRIPTIRDVWAKHAFFGSAFAAVAFTLYIPGVYEGVDRLLGGGNRVGLVLSELVIASLWQIYVSLRLATAERGGELPPDTLKSISVIRMCWLVCASTMFLTSFFWDTPESTRWLISVYGAQLPLLVFQVAAVSFIAGISVSAVAICWPRRQEFGGLFRAGFAAVVVGFASAAVIVGGRLVGNFLPVGSQLKHLVESSYELGQQIVVLLVSIGLSLPRLTVVAMSATASVKSLVLVRRLLPTWSRVVACRGTASMGARRDSLFSRYRWNVLARLQRRVTEIRDAHAVSDTAECFLSSQELQLLEQAETLLYGTRNKNEVTE